LTEECMSVKGRFMNIIFEQRGKEVIT